MKKVLAIGLAAAAPAAELLNGVAFAQAPVEIERDDFTWEWRGWDTGVAPALTLLKRMSCGYAT